MAPAEYDAAPAINYAQEGFIKGHKVWVAVDDQTWQMGELRSLPGEGDGGPAPPPLHPPEGGSGRFLRAASPLGPLCVVQMEEGGTGGRGRSGTSASGAATGPTYGVELARLAPSNPQLQEGIPDLTHLSYLNEPGILYNLRFRYAKDQIYTFAGPVLIALNPCKSLPLYTQEVATRYKVAARGTMHMLEPHIYLVAANAFRNMLREQTSQSLIVNGESGAGKTETTKKAMQYFATLAGGTGVEDQVLETNPVLEAFGNAKTLRNHNSSRFGKLIQIHFNQSSRICGARIKTYLLEKSRVVHQLPGERSYHIFYQLVRGVDKWQREELRLPSDPTVFRYLAQSGCTTIDGVDDAQEFVAVCNAMTAIGLEPANQAALMRLLAGVLWLGNVEILPRHDDDDSTTVENNAALDNACHLLGLDKVHLCMALTQRRIITPHEIVTKLLNVEGAVEARDALAKALYAAIFNWVVAQINATLDTAASKRTSGHCISILDIYGFEQFKKNSFEQLCINYANERLQQQFTRHLFTLEQAEYESEGIDWTKIEFVDNQECVDVIEMTPPKGLGVLSVLDAQCRFPKATDDTLAFKLKETLSAHSHFEFNPRMPSDFLIKHYAGQVQYTTTGFLDKNKDTLSADLLEVLAGSGSELLRQLGANIKDELENKRGGGQTVGGRFSVQLRDLITELDATGLHFVRCIKPNAALQPNSFESEMTLQQLRCCGVLEVARVARAGFPTRYLHGQFVARYALLLGPQHHVTVDDLENDPEGARRACLLLLELFQLGDQQYQLGHTKVFFRPGVLGFVEDRWARMQASALVIQKTWRMFCCRSAFLLLRDAVVEVQTAWRAREARLFYELYKRQQKAALLIQRVWRGHRQQKAYTTLVKATVLIQMWYRRYCFRKGVRRREYERRLVERAAKLEQESFVALRREYGVEMSEVRTALAVWHACRAKGITNAAQVAAELEAAGLAHAEAGAAMQAARAASLRVTQERVSELGLAPGPADEGAGEGVEEGAARGREGSGGEGGVKVMVLVVKDDGGVVAPPPAPPPQPVGFEKMQELHVELERSRLERAKLGKELHAQKMLKERDNVKAAEAQAKMLTMIRELQAYVAMVKGEYAKHHMQLPPLPAPLLAAAPSTPHPAAAPAAASALGAGADAGSTREVVGTPGDAAAAGQLPVAAAQLPPAAPATAVPVPAAAEAAPPAEAAPKAAEAAATPAPVPPVGHKGAAASERAPAAPVAAAAAGGAALASKAASQRPPGHQPMKPPARGALAARGTAGAGGGGRGGAVDASSFMMHGDSDEEGESKHGAQPSSRPPASPFENKAPQASALAAAAAAQPQSRSPARSAASRIPSVAPDSPSRRAEPGAGAVQVAASSRPTAPEPAPRPQSSSQKYVVQLSSELEKVSRVLTDDVDFILEVRQGRAEAPDMDPAYELAKLKKKFEIWKKEFKDKLGTTEEVLKKLERMAGGGFGAAGGRREAIPGGPSVPGGGFTQGARAAPPQRAPPPPAPPPPAQSKGRGILGGLFK